MPDYPDFTRRSTESYKNRYTRVFDVTIAGLDFEFPEKVSHLKIMVEKRDVLYEFDKPIDANSQRLPESGVLTIAYECKKVYLRGVDGTARVYIEAIW